MNIKKFGYCCLLIYLIGSIIPAIYGIINCILFPGVSTFVVELWIMTICTTIVPILSFIMIICLILEKKCSGCGRCLRIGHCEAISLKGSIAIIESKKCIGCAVCKFICPADAIYLKGNGK